MPVPPLNPHVRIVDESGRPTPEFIRWWQSQRDENSGIPDLTDPDTVSGALDSIGDTRGQILYRGETEWLPLSSGTDNYVLTSTGPGNDPAWASAVRAFLDLSDAPDAYTGAGGKVVGVKATEDGLEFGDLVSTFLDLSDAPDAYTGAGGKVVGVKATEDGLEFVTGGGGGGASAFTDLSDAPDEYTGAGGYAVTVKSDETGLEFGLLSNVAFSGAYSDLTDTPPTSITLSTETSAFAVTNTHLSGLQHVACDFAADDDVTIPSGLTGTEPVRFLSVGTGRPSFVPASGVTILALNDNGLMLGPGAQATLIPLGADEYLLWGDIGSDALLLLSGDESGYVLLSGDANSGSSRLELSGA